MTTPPQVLGRPPASSPLRTVARRPPGPWRAHLDRAVPRGLQLVALVVIALTLLALSYGMNHMTYLTWGAFWVAPVLLLLSLPIVNRASRIDGDAIGRIVVCAAVVKIFVSPLVRYWMAFAVYGRTDANRYHNAGSLLADLFRHGEYGDLGRISGTRFLEVLTGQFYVFTGPTRLGGFMVFSWLGFLGCYLFFRAFRTAYPEADGRRYAILVFFFPTLLFWPSSIGKEAFMMLALGAAALGAAQLLASRFGGLIWLGLGLWGATIVRPHMALICGAGLAVAAPIALLRGAPRDVKGRHRSRLGGAVLVLSLLLAGPTLIGVAERFFGLDSLNSQTAEEVFDEVARRTAQAGSSFTPISPNNPVGFVMGGATVLFRPFPFEAHNAQTLLASIETVILLLLCCVSLRRLARVPKEVFRSPYVAFTLAYTFAFIYAFSSLGNFGILARERSMLLPALFVALCVPRVVQPAVDESPEASLGEAPVNSRDTAAPH